MASRAVRLLVYSGFNPSGHWSGAPQPLTNQKLCWKSADLATAWTPNSGFSSRTLSLRLVFLSLLSTLCASALAGEYPHPGT